MSDILDCSSCVGCPSNTNKKLIVYDWLANLNESQEESLVEVQFKNTRKSYFVNPYEIELKRGDMVAVESSPGHDIGEVTLTGKLVSLQIKKNNYDVEKYGLKKIYRIARDIDLEKYKEAKSKEQQTMIKSRQIAESLDLQMKIGDVEYQGDGNKAIFYYIADERVDFRQLIKVFAETFQVKIEMKQIGARQEAGRIGGIGPCGRELCCSKWMTNFNSVSTTAARTQDISLNPQKLAGMCGKLKCCMNYELDTYVEAQKKLPSRDVQLEVMEGTYYHFKTDVLKGEMSYSTDQFIPVNLVTISSSRSKAIIEMNKKGIKPEKLDDTVVAQKKEHNNYENVVGQDSLTRFDNKKQNQRRKNRKSNNRRNNSKPDNPKGNA